MSQEEQEAWLEAEAELDAPFDPEEWWDPKGPPPPGEDELTPDELAEIRRAADDEMLAAEAAMAGRRGPGHAGSARVFPGESSSPAAAFGAGLALDVMPGCAGLAVSADAAAGDDDRFDGVADHELVGVLCAWDRVEAHAAARKLAAVAELIRRRPEAGCAPEGPARMPTVWDEFAEDELAVTLGESRGRAGGLLTMAWQLEARLPGTKAALRDGTVTFYKAQLIAAATQVLDPAEARAAEEKILGRAGRLTPGGLRAAILRAVMEVAPEKAQKRREQAARDARVQRWAEDSGNAALMGRELPPAEVLAADQRITAWAKQLRAAGLDGDMDVLRARAYLDLLLGKDSRLSNDARVADGPAADGPAADGGSADPGVPADSAAQSASGPHVGAAPTGFAGRATLTVPLATLLELAERPGEIPGIGPIDPALARDLARAAARNPRTTWCVTVTDEQGHAIGHGCARPEPKGRRRQREKPRNVRPRAGPGFAFTAVDGQGPPDGYGIWRLSTGGGRPRLLVALDPIVTEPCDHRYEAKGHDPGVKLRHLAEVRHATCTAPACRRPAMQCDFEHNVPYEADGQTCMCNGGPKCRHDHRLKQHPKWQVDQLPGGIFRWTAPSGRRYETEPTRYPI
ncbi:MAG: DUF222 domain-containing protein [Actinobacteria bacterium]|nr:DUF222 domain-containing protein [Actinomycetota bacterium]